MESVLAVLVFFGITLGLVALPLVPHLVEWRKKTDAEPLCVVRDFEVDIRHFAKSFSAYIESQLKPSMDNCRETGKSVEGALEDGTTYIIVSDDNTSVLTTSEKKIRTSERIILSVEDLKLPELTMYTLEIYAGGSVQGGERGIYRAMLAEDGIHLGDESISLRWLHAGTVVRARAGCILCGRVSADGSILLADNCRFERLNAPLIEFGGPLEAGDKGASDKGTPQVTPLKPEELPGKVEVAAGRWLVDNTLKIPTDKLIDADLIATGKVRIGKGTRVNGCIKSHKDLYIESDVEFGGSVVSGQDLHIGEGCRIRGTVLAERNVFIEKGVTIGTPYYPTTVSAKCIYIMSGVVAHGTVWAHKDGQVRPLDEAVKKKGL